MTWAEFKNFFQENLEDDRVEKLKVRASEPTTPRSNNLESSTKARWKKKKDRRQNDQRQRQQKGSIPVTGVNAAKAGKPKKKNNDRNQNCLTARDFSQVKCYRCQKLGHYANNSLAISVPVTEVSKENEMALAQVPYIHFPLRFQKDTNKV